MAALAALVILMILGTQVLHWFFPVLLLLIFLAVGWWRLRGRIPTDYQIAQAVDERLALKDSLSTAYYFSSGEANKNPHPAIVEAQRRQAESAAASADPVAAAPVSMPRAVWGSVGLLALSLALLAARYGISGTLDLTQPLVHIPFDSFLAQPDAAAKRPPLPKQKLPKGAENVAVPSDLPDQQAGEKKEAMEQDGVKGEAIETDQPGPKTGQQAKNSEPSAEKGGNDQGDANEKGEGKAGAEDKGREQSGASDSAGKQNAKSQQGGNNSAQQQQGNDSMMDKMKDAMANMLSRMRMSPRASEGGQKNMQANQGSAQQAGNKQQSGKKGAPTQGKGEGEQSSDQEGDQQGEGASKNMAASNRTDGASDQQAPQEGKSGAGKQDGEKEIKAAEQAAAISKISELLGKRAKDLTGEVMVEVSSGRQQLKTEMSQRNSAHSDSGGDVHRDEVPAAYQHFVQQYFEQLRKPSAAKPPAAVPVPKNP